MMKAILPPDPLPAASPADLAALVAVVQPLVLPEDTRKKLSTLNIPFFDSYYKKRAFITQDVELSVNFSARGSGYTITENFPSAEPWVTITVTAIEWQNITIHLDEVPETVVDVLMTEREFRRHREIIAKLREYTPSAVVAHWPKGRQLYSRRVHQRRGRKELPNVTDLDRSLASLSMLGARFR